MRKTQMSKLILVVCAVFSIATAARAADLSGEWLMHWDLTPNGSVDPEPNNTEPRLSLTQVDATTFKGYYTNMDNPGHLVMRSIGPSATPPIVMEQDGSLAQPNVNHWVAYSGRILGDGSIKGFYIDNVGRSGDFNLVRLPASK